MKAHRVAMSVAAGILGKSPKTLQRWRKRTGAPFGKDGSVDPAKLEAWAENNGLLDRPAHRPPDVERLLQDAAPASTETAASTLGTTSAAPAAAPEETPAAAPEGDAEADPLSSAESEAIIEALQAGDADKLIELARTCDKKFVSKLAAVARMRRETAEASRRELENKLKRGELLERADVQRFWHGQIQIVQQHFATLPGKLATRLLGQNDYDAIYQMLDDELRALLTVFAQELPSA